MNPQKQELLEKLKGANNILVTVSANPSVDQLAACIGMTLLLNKLKKHATAVFSGAVPSTIEFLKPEETIEKNTDSLRDFIISLDKSKADKLRYKVEDQVVRIFITPYKTSISQEDLEFGQGDFNVDVVLCLGVNKQEDLDQAITSHGRILHDAVVISINTQNGGELGAINWTEPAASSLSELVSGVAEALGKELLDAQIATALLTGIVAETDRFSNEKTSPETMRLSAELMSAGANQQLVATELETPPEPPETPASDDTQDDSKGPDDDASPPADTTNQDGTLEITHPEPPASEATETPQTIELPEPQDQSEPTSEAADTAADDDDGLDDILGSLDPNVNASPEPSVDKTGTAPPVQAEALPTPEPPHEQMSVPASRLILQPPSLGGTLTANSTPEDQSVPNPLSTPPDNSDVPILDRSISATPPTNIEPPAQTAVPVPQPASSNDQINIDSDGNLHRTDAAVPAGLPSSDAMPSPQPIADSTPLVSVPEALATLAEPAQDVNVARDAVDSAINSAPPTGPLPPTASSGATGYLNVQDLEAANAAVSTPDLTEAAAGAPAVQPGPGSLPLPTPVPQSTTPPSSTPQDGSTPPPVPPPLPFSDLSKFSPPSSQQAA